MWYFPLEQSYKPYPHCRILHAPLDVLTSILEQHDIKPAEIESITAWVEGWVMKPLMDKVHYEVHPGYTQGLAADAASRPARIEVKARGQTFTAETLYPKGSLSPDPSTRMTNEEITAKFVRNADGVMTPRAIDRTLDQLWNLDRVTDLPALMSTLCPR